MSHCVLLMRSTRYWIVGPFETQHDAGSWGRRTQADVKDDPRWQTIQLESPESAPVVLSPEDPRAQENGEPD